MKELKKDYKYTDYRYILYKPVEQEKALPAVITGLVAITAGAFTTFLFSII